MSTERYLVRTLLGAGKWFPSDKTALQAMTEAFIADAYVPEIEGHIVAVISPHAGYPYSGAVAGHVFRAIRDNTAGQHPQTVVVLGFSHRQPFRGIAVMDGSAVRSPLAETSIDKDSVSFLLAADPRIAPDYKPHIGEHSAENQVPFIQSVLPDAALVMLLMGSHDPALLEALSSALVKLAGRKRILVVASSDMLHDPDYDRVRKTDQATLRKITAMDTTGVMRDWDYSQQVFCGIAPVISAMKYALAQGCRKATVLRYRNSGDDNPETRGQWVVGYGAVAFAA